jgi:hypothetical protein
MKSFIMIIGLMLVGIISKAQTTETLPDELYRSEWRQSETRLLFLKTGEINDIGLNKTYQIISITKSNGNYTVIASYNNYYLNIFLGTDNIIKSNALMISYDPNNLYNDFDAAVQGKNGRTGWLYREKP